MEVEGSDDRETEKQRLDDVDIVREDAKVIEGFGFNDADKHVVQSELERRVGCYSAYLSSLGFGSVEVEITDLSGR